MKDIKKHAYLPNLEVAVFIEQNIAWLQITMDDICRVQKLERSQDLVNEVLNVLG